MRVLVTLLAVLCVQTAAAAAPARASNVAQTRHLEAAKAALTRLRGDARRRRYRDGWEAVLRELALAVSAAPAGARAVEAQLLAARVRTELWEVSRSPADAKAADAALQKLAAERGSLVAAEALALEKAFAAKAHLEQTAPVAAGAPVEVASPDDDEDVGAAPRPPLRAAPVAAASPAAQKPLAEETAGLIQEMIADAKKSAPTPAPAAAAPPSEKPAPADEQGEDDEDVPEPEAPESLPSRSPPLVKAVKNAVAALTEPEDDPTAAARARELRTTALAAHESLAAQLGLKVRRVVIDAGHGGKDTGAIGPHGLREKDVALAIARKVAARLKLMGFEAVLTRKDDTFVPLDDRTRIANEAKADLFVSIHCNAARRRTLAGVETWTLNVAADRYAARLAAFENADAEHTVSDLRLILADLATKANASDARELAQSVQSSLVRNLRSRIGKVRDNGTKQALFYVLLGTHMPSILVETAFISNPSEESRLRSSRFQEGTADAIARGVKEFVESRQRLARAP